MTISRATHAAPLIAALVVAVGCGATRPLPRGGAPKASRRDSPPPGIEDSAAAVGSSARPFGLVSSAGGSWSLRETLARKPVVLVFYRGSW